MKLTNHAAGHDEVFRLSYEEIKLIPCTDIKRLNDLWIKYSEGRFGFSKQRDIYLSSGGHPGGKVELEAWERFARKVGWNVSNRGDVNYSMKASIGHLPAIIHQEVWLIPWNKKWIPSLAEHLEKCNI